MQYCNLYSGLVTEDILCRIDIICAMVIDNFSPKAKVAENWVITGSCRINFKYPRLWDNHKPIVPGTLTSNNGADIAASVAIILLQLSFDTQVGLTYLISLSYNKLSSSVTLPLPCPILNFKLSGIWYSKHFWYCFVFYFPRNAQIVWAILNVDQTCLIV